MTIKNIAEARKYIGKVIYTANNYGRKANSKNRVQKLYIGGVHLFYNQVDYNVLSFELYENEKSTKGWGKVNLTNIADNFEPGEYDYYFFSLVEATKYCEWINKDEVERERERDIAEARELLKKHKINFEIFD